jgi:hypothetical protein
MAETERPTGRRAIDAIKTGVAAARDPIASRVGQAVDTVERKRAELPGARVRRVRRMGSQPLARLADVHPDANNALPVEIGLRTIDVADIAGTAVAGGDQRGGDFLPLRQFRGKNWKARWQRLQKAQDRMAALPPIEVVKFGGRYWVEDGHNRVALALYTGQVGMDADVTERVPSGGVRTEPLGSLAATAAGSSSVRTAAGGQATSGELAHEERFQPVEPDGGP